jgi:hypothetical protein
VRVWLPPGISRAPPAPIRFASCLLALRIRFALSFSGDDSVVGYDFRLSRDRGSFGRPCDLFVVLHEQDLILKFQEMAICKSFFGNMNQLLHAFSAGMAGADFLISFVKYNCTTPSLVTGGAQNCIWRLWTLDCYLYLLLSNLRNGISFPNIIQTSLCAELKESDFGQGDAGCSTSRPCTLNLRGFRGVSYTEVPDVLHDTVKIPLLV